MSERPDFLDMTVRKHFDVPEGYVPTGFDKATEPTMFAFYNTEAGVYKSGKWKGHTKYGKDRLTYSVTKKQIEQCIEDWKKETGLCADCGGSGRRLVGWGKETGARYKPCACGTVYKESDDAKD